MGELDFTIDPWPAKAEVLRRVPNEAIQALDSLHRLAIDPSLRDEVEQQPAITVPIGGNKGFATRLMIGDILTDSLNPRLAGAIILRAHGVEPWDAVQLLMHHYPGMYISNNQSDRDTAPRFGEVVALASQLILQDSPGAAGAALIRVAETSYRLTKAKQHTDPSFADSGYRLQKRSASILSSKSIAIGGLYAIKQQSKLVAKTLTDWGECSTIYTATSNVGRALRAIRESPVAPRTLAAYVDNVDRLQGDKRQPVRPWHEAAAAEFISGLSFNQIATMHNVSGPAVARAIDSLISRYAASEDQDRPEYYQLLVESREARRRM